ncbi:hypothetical protein QE152_g5764 [Popillia japonica]|uniref:Uncharacterized protein n=1 Tax=Popillia japonica TaxID=7064 RepID=A0AAW1MJG1_POPJA
MHSAELSAKDLPGDLNCEYRLLISSKTVSSQLRETGLSAKDLPGDLNCEYRLLISSKTVSSQLRETGLSATKARTNPWVSDAKRRKKRLQSPKKYTSWTDAEYRHMVR